MTILRPAAALAVTILILNVAPVNSQQTELDVAEPVQSAMLSGLARCDAHCQEPDILAVATMLQAARRLDKSNSEAAELLAESLEVLGDISGALSALDDYAAMAPDNEVALAKGISLGLESLQTSEDRRTYLWRLANQANLPQGVAGAVYQELAQLSFEAAEEQEAGRQFLSQAMSVDPYNLPARQKMLELMGAEAKAPQRIGLLAQMVRINPLRLQVVWDFANTLDETGLHKEAQKWYKYAIGAHLAGAGGSEVGAGELLDLAASYVLSQDHDKALLVLNRIVGQNPEQVSVYIWLARAASGLGQVEQAQNYLLTAEKLLLGQSQGNPDELIAANQLAWFYLQDKADKNKALEWAEKAVALDPQDNRAQLCLGLALLANGDTDQARAKLEPLAENDPWARLGMIRIQLAGEHTEEEIQQALGQALGQHSGGWVGLAGRELAKAHNIDMSGIEQFLQRNRQGINNQLGKPAELRDFYRHPQDYLFLKLRPRKPEFSYREPLMLDISLTNMGSMAITMGPGMMLDPQLVLSARLSGGLQRDLKDDFVSLYKKRKLNPGEGLSTTLRLDRGEFRRLLRACPQETVTIRLSCILDPQVVGQDEYLPSLGGQVSKEVLLVRYGFQPSTEAMNQVYRLLKDGPVRSRISSAILLGDLLANSQSPRAVPEARMPRAIDEQQVTAALMEIARAADWRVRAWLGEALQSVRLNTQLSEALADQIRDPHWFVRFMAVRAVGQRGQRWTEILQRVAQTDADDLVRQMAGCYIGPTK